MPTHRRTQWFDDAHGDAPAWQRASAPPLIEAQATVDRAIQRLGIDPKQAAGPEGWRQIALGTAQGSVNVIEWKQGLHFLVVYTPMLRAPKDARLRADLFEALLALNHKATGMARFSLHDEMIVLAAVRPIQGLDTNEVLDAIRFVMVSADGLDERLQHLFEVPMPDIEVDDQTWRKVLDLLRLCDGHAQQVFSYLMERWQAEKGSISSGKSAIVLVGRRSSDTVAAFIGHASAGPIVAVGWDSLQKVHGVRPRDASAFKEAMPRPERFKTTAHSAHLPVDDSFTQEMADQLIDALLRLDKALEHAVPPPVPRLPDLSVWGLEIQVGGATQRNIHALLAACPEPVQEIYAKLIQGWHETGQALYTSKPDRVYLRLAVDGHRFALCTLWGPKKAQGPRIELTYPLSYYFDAHLEARRHYEQQVAGITGFRVQGSRARILMEAFTTRDADKLFRVLRKLAEDVG